MTQMMALDQDEPTIYLDVLDHDPPTSDFSRGADGKSPNPQSSREVPGRGFGGTRADPVTVLFLHGTGRHSGLWSDYWREPPAGYRYLAVDLPGHGRSRATCPDTVAGIAQTVLETLDRLGVERAVLVGQSLGGGVAIEVACQRPERVLALGLVATGARLRVNAMVLQLAELAAQGKYTIGAEARLAYGPTVSNEQFESMEGRFADVDPKATYRAWLACNQFDRMSDLATITAPTLVVCGDQDMLTPLKYHQHLADTLPDALLDVVEGAGHMLPAEAPQRFYDILANFLASEVPSHS